VLVRGLLAAHPQQVECAALVNDDAVSCCHSLAETFNTLTGFFHVPNELAAEMVESLTMEMRFEAISQRDYLHVLREARRRGVQGGIIYDALHAQIARRLGVERIISYNLSNFRHVAPEIAVESP
jgi:predicted nucleic acid-binding protein